MIEIEKIRVPFAQRLYAVIVGASNKIGRKVALVIYE